MEKRWKDIETFFNESAQLKLIGAQVDLSDPQKPKVCIHEVRDIHRGGVGGEAVNGGIISMLVDLSIGLLGLTYLGEGLTATSHLSIHFVKPLHGQKLLLEAAITEVIGNRIFGKASAMNEKGEICTYASGVVAKAIKG
jgi:acyl-coenzyme A thioesterase PaaI-like protein